MILHVLQRICFPPLLTTRPPACPPAALYCSAAALCMQLPITGNAGRQRQSASPPPAAPGAASKPPIVFPLAPLCVRACVSDHVLQSGSSVLTDGESGGGKRRGDSRREGGSEACWVHPPLKPTSFLFCQGTLCLSKPPLPGPRTCSEAWR